MDADIAAVVEVSVPFVERRRRFVEDGLAAASTGSPKPNSWR